MNLDTLSVMEAEKLTRFSTRVKGKDAVAFILFARISEIRDAYFLSAVGGNSCSPTGDRVPRKKASSHQASRSSHQHTTTGRRCQSVPTPTQAAKWGLQAADLGQRSTCHRRFWPEATDCNLGFREGALPSCYERSAVEPGQGQMRSVGYDTIYAPRISSGGPAISSLQTVHPART